MKSIAACVFQSHDSARRPARINACTRVVADGRRDGVVLPFPERTPQWLTILRALAPVESLPAACHRKSLRGAETGVPRPAVHRDDLQGAA